MQRLVSGESVAFFRDEGYLRDLPAVLSRSELDELVLGFNQLVALLKGGEDHREIRRWHPRAGFCMICARIESFWTTLRH